MIRIGLFMYDHLGKRTSLPGSTGLRFGAESVLKPEIVRGFEYSDCWVDDARTVLANAQMVVRKGGEVRTRTRAISAKRENGLWVVEAEDIDSGEKFTRRRAVWSMPPVHGSNSSSTKGCICARLTVSA